MLDFSIRSVTFATRYANVPMWTAFQESDRRIVVEAYRIIEEGKPHPHTLHGKTNEPAQAKWKIINDRMSTELGLHELSPRGYSYRTPYNRKPYNDRPAPGHGITSASSWSAGTSRRTLAA